MLHLPSHPPNLLINGINSRFICCEPAPEFFQNYNHNLIWDLYTNGYGMYYVYQKDNRWYVKPKTTTINGLPKSWPLEDDSKIIILDHEVAELKSNEKGSLHNGSMYENSYGLYEVYSDKLGRKKVYHHKVWKIKPQLIPEPFEWYLDEDYQRLHEPGPDDFIWSLGD